MSERDMGFCHEVWCVRENHVVSREKGGASASLKDMQRSHSLGTRASLDSTIIQCNTAHVFLNHYREAENTTLQTLKERAAARGWRL